METIISKISEKISRYEILNNLIPGTALCFILSYIGYPILDYSTGVCIMICYLVGLINSRFSSLVIEWLCRKTKLIEWRDYSLYNSAKKERPFVGALQENANVYRAFVSVFFVSLIAYGIQKLILYCTFLQDYGLWILLSLMFLLFLLSYRKQVNEYVVKNIDEVESLKKQANNK
jgi:uncharacterized membrane protein YbhN (UPF0104 family)